MKILQIINNIAWGGAGNLLVNYVPLMKEMGYDVEILVLKRIDNHHYQNFRKSGIKVTSLSENSLYNPLFIFRIRNFINKGNFDIVHVHLFPALYYVGLASYFGAKSLFVFTEHNTWNIRMSNLFFRAIDKLIYKRYNTIICISNKVKGNIKKHLSGLKINYHLVYNGINLVKFAIDNKPSIDRKDLFFEYSDDNIIVVMVGRFEASKDQKTLIKTMKLLPAKFHLLLIGEGLLKFECEKLTTELDLDKRVHFLGIRKDVPDILKLCDIGVLSSNWEGMPVFAIEIMATGIPFVGSKVPGIQDLIEIRNDNAGILFTHGDSKELAACINKLITDKDLYKRISDAGKLRASEYSIEKMTNQYLDVYKHLIEND